jgi:hypothetical protein
MGWMKLGKSDWRYLYQPFDTDDIKALIPWIESDDNNKKQTKIVSAGAAANPEHKGMVDAGYLQANLSDVPAHVPVYVVAHGDKGADYIEDQSHSHQMSADQLAEKMGALKKGHKVIKLFLCNVGIDLLSGQKGFGFNFWKAMHDKEYNNLWVVCYLGITVNAGMKAYKGVQTDDKLVPASEKRIFIAPDGKIYQPGDKVPDLA